MPLIYIAGSYRCPPWKPTWLMHIFYPVWKVWEFCIVANNIWKARQVAKKYWTTYAVICPHMNTAFFPESYADWLSGDIEILKKCDKIVMMRGWRKSSGAMAERQVAMDKKIEIIYEDDIDVYTYQPQKYVAKVWDKSK